MEVLGSYIPVILIVLAIFGGYWRTSKQYADLMAVMATKEDIKDMATKDDIKILDDQIGRFETHVNQQFAEIRGEISNLKRDVNTLQQSYVNHLITEHNVRPMQPS